MIFRPASPVILAVALNLFCTPPAYTEQAQPPRLLVEWNAVGSTGFALALDGTAYVTIGAGRIAKYTGDGEFLLDWGSREPGGRFRSITGLAVSPSGSVYSCEYYGNRVQVFDGNGHFIRAWGSKGRGPGQFDGPGGLAIDRRGIVYVIDRGNHRIQKFTAGGKYLSAWGSPRGSTSYLDLPVAIAASGDDRVYVTDFAVGGIRVFTQDGRFIARWGPGPGEVPLIKVISSSTDRAGVTSALGVPPTLTSELARVLCDSTTHQASGIAVDPSGVVYVVNGACHRVQKFTRDGAFLGGWWISERPTYVGSGEAALAVGREGELFVADADGHVRVFGYGPSHYERLLSRGVTPNFSRIVDSLLSLPVGQPCGALVARRRDAGAPQFRLRYVGFSRTPILESATWDVSLREGTPTSELPRIEWALRGVLESRGISSAAPAGSRMPPKITRYEGAGIAIRSSLRRDPNGSLSLRLERFHPVLEIAKANPDTCDLRVLEGELNEPAGLWSALGPALRARWPQLAGSISAGDASLADLLHAVEKAASPQVPEADRDLVLLAADQWLRSRSASGSPEAFRDALGPDWNRYGFGSARYEGPGAFVYCGSVLKAIAMRAGRGNEWADRALIVLLDQGWNAECTGVLEDAHFGNELFVPVLKHGEGFLKSHPGSRVWPSIALRVALAHETVWSLAKEAPANDYPDYKPGAPEHLRRALELYRKLLARTKDPRMTRALRRRISDLEHGRDTKCQVYYLTGEC